MFEIWGIGIIIGCVIWVFFVCGMIIIIGCWVGIGDWICVWLICCGIRMISCCWFWFLLFFCWGNWIVIVCGVVLIGIVFWLGWIICWFLIFDVFVGIVGICITKGFGFVLCLICFFWMFCDKFGRLYFFKGLEEWLMRMCL